MADATGLAVPSWVYRAQFWLLVLASLVILFSAPHQWAFNADSGVYVGTAVALGNDLRYWFNGFPNLLYYPGTSLIIAAVNLIAGVDFHVLGVVFGGFAVAVFWLSRALFSLPGFGWTGVLVPLFMAGNSILLVRSHNLGSDIVFLDIVLFSMLSWRYFETSGNRRWFVVCLILLALAPLFRFQGLFLIAAFSGALVFRLLRNRRLFSTEAITHLAATSLTLLPFVAWTARNYYSHTPETYNMANNFFFGLSGMAISGPGFGAADWIDAAWKVPFYQAMFLFGRLGKSFFGDLGPHIPYEIATAGVLILLSIGGWALARKPSYLGAFALLFTAINIVFTTKQFMGGESVYVVHRYWIPILPFVALTMGLAFGVVLDLVRESPSRTIIVRVIATLVVVAGLTGNAMGLTGLYAEDRHARIQLKWESAQSVAKFAKSNIPESARIMTTDWGVGPYLLERQSYQVLRSSCDRPSLEIIRDKSLDYLVVMPNMMRNSRAQNMVESWPEVFSLMYEVGEELAGYGAVYSIDRTKIAGAIERADCDWDAPH